MRSVGITIMHDTTAGTAPYSYIQLTQSTRPAFGETSEQVRLNPDSLTSAYNTPSLLALYSKSVRSWLSGLYDAL